VNLTQGQKDVLRVLVRNHQLHGGSEFILLHNRIGWHLVYGLESISVTADEADFKQLRDEKAITLYNVQPYVYRGKPTQFGIESVTATGGVPISSGTHGSIGSTARNASDETAEKKIDPSVFRKQGKVWELSFVGKTVHVPDRVGLGYISELLRSPGQAVDAVQLAGASSAAGKLPQSRSIPLADEKAIRTVRQNLEERKAALNELGPAEWVRRGDLEAEIGKLEEYLRQVQSLRGDSRRIKGTAERARTSVTNAIDRAIEKLSQEHQISVLT
jgi:hypothetical protein